MNRAVVVNCSIFVSRRVLFHCTDLLAVRRTSSPSVGLDRRTRSPAYNGANELGAIVLAEAAKDFVPNRYQHPIVALDRRGIPKIARRTIATQGHRLAPSPAVIGADTGLIAEGRPAITMRRCSGLSRSRLTERRAIRPLEDRFVGQRGEMRD